MGVKTRAGEELLDLSAALFHGSPQYIAAAGFCIREHVSLVPLVQKTLILVAHPDDEAIGCGALLQRIKQPLVVFATTGVPQDPYFWQPHGSQAQYAAVRHKEAVAALAEVGVTHCGFLGFEDQRLFRQLEPALA